MKRAFRFGLKAFRTAIVSLLLISLGGVVGFKLGTGQGVPVVSQTLNFFPQLSRVVQVEQPQDFSPVDFSQFWEVWRQLERTYVDPNQLDAKKMVYGAIQGMTSAIGDPYTVYLPPDEQKRSQEDLQGSFDGVGIQLGYKNQTLAVIAPLKGMPAEGAGVHAGDYILRIRDDKKNIDRDTYGISLAEAVSLIRGEKGSVVHLTFLTEGKEPEEKALVRNTIVVPSVELSMVDLDGKRVAHLILSKFGERTEDEWDTAVRQILSEKSSLNGIVLDLRNNAGGYLQASVDLASDFIEDGIVVTQQGRDSKQDYAVTHVARLKDIPTVVLVNQGTASAAEILSGALRDKKGIKLIGEKTFGKGTVQDALSDLPNGAGMHITIAKWLLPSGDWIHDKGIQPDVELSDTIETEDIDEVFQKGVELL